MFRPKFYQSEEKITRAVLGLLCTFSRSGACSLEPRGAEQGSLELREVVQESLEPKGAEQGNLEPTGA